MNDHDPTESVRRSMIESGQPARDLAETTSKKYTTAELQEDFDVLGFLAPFVVVRRKSDGKKGTMQFVHAPRTYFDFCVDGDKK